MPLPNAQKESPRVYKILKIKTLDSEAPNSLTQAEIASVGNPLSVEELNEDELRRLVLVNLARLTVAGEWDGLLSAGGGGGTAFALTKYNWDGDTDPVRILALPPYGNGNHRDLNVTTPAGLNQLCFFPFVAPTSGTMSAVDFYVKTASETGSIDVGIYSDNEGVPETFLGEFVMSVTSTGNVSQTSSSATITTVRGTQYWLSMFGDSLGSTSPIFAGLEFEGTMSPVSVGNYGSTAILNAIMRTATSTDGNATITDWTLYEPAGLEMPNFGVKW